MDPSPASPILDKLPESEEMPAEVREALKEVQAAVEDLIRDQETAITELAFERAAELRERAEALKRRKERILHEWQQNKAANPPNQACEINIQADRPRE
jgi:ATP-dependent Clp protease ATP-binding subunit ClpC